MSNRFRDVSDPRTPGSKAEIEYLAWEAEQTLKLLITRGAHETVREITERVQKLLPRKAA